MGLYFPARLEREPSRSVGRLVVDVWRGADQQVLLEHFGASPDVQHRQGREGNGKERRGEALKGGEKMAGFHPGH